MIAGAPLSLVDPADGAWLLLLWSVTGLVTDAMAVAGRSRLALVAAVTAGVSAATVLDDVLTVGLPALPTSPLAQFALHCPAVTVHCHPPTFAVGPVSALGGLVAVGIQGWAGKRRGGLFNWR